MAKHVAPDSNGSRQTGGAISLRQVVKRYGPNAAPAVDNLSLDIAPGEFVVLLGTSGSGKTTLLKMVNRLIEPTSGSIEINGQDAISMPAPDLRRTIGYVIQQAGLFPHMRVQDNVAVVPRLLKWDRRAIEDRVRELLDLVGLPFDSYARRYPSQLSGGEQQRVGLARAMAARPSTLLMDEPFGALDAITRTRLQGELRRIHQNQRHTILFVTHDVDEAFSLADRIVVMHQGKMEQVGTPLELMSEPASEFVGNLVNAGDAIRRLGLIPVSAAITPAPDGYTRSGPSLHSGASLRDALNVLVSSGATTVAVMDDNQSLLGVVTIDSLRGTAAAPGAVQQEATANHES